MDFSKILVPLLVGAGVVVLVLFFMSFVSDWRSQKKVKAELERRKRLAEERHFDYRW